MNDIFQIYMEPWRKFAQFNGRAARAEYWIFGFGNVFIFLAILFGGIGLSVVTDEPAFFSLGLLFYVVFALATFIPQIAVTVRRLHDTGKSGAYFFVNFVPLVGGLIFFFFMIQEGDFRKNQYDLPEQRRRRKRSDSDPEVRERPRTRKRRRPEATLDYADPEDEPPRKRRRKRPRSEDEPPRKKRRKRPRSEEGPPRRRKRRDPDA